MLRRIVNWLFLAPVALIAVILAVANRTPVTLSVDPFARASSALSVTVPLFAVVFLAMILGVIIGGMAVWWKQGRYRKRCRLAESELSAARSDVERLRNELGRGDQVSATTGGALAFLNRPAA
ncbi:MAG: hypothetical protein FD152_1663 [Xanthobacteraceae bacterium]|nr:MAG: hypothetical protein FD152_1663 [Xanthobacteraceae bacterium]